MATTDPASDRQPAGHVQELINALMITRERLFERRKTPRHAITKVFSVQPLDIHGTACGEEVSAITRDISLSGASLFVHQEMTTPFLLIQDKQGEISIQIKLRILRRRPLTAWCFEVAGEFVQ